MNTIDSELIQTSLAVQDEQIINITADISGLYGKTYELSDKIYKLSKSMENMGADIDKLKESFEELSKGLERLERLNGADTEKPKGDLDIFDLSFDEILAYPIGLYI